MTYGGALAIVAAFVVTYTVCRWLAFRALRRERRRLEERSTSREAR